MMRKHPLFFYFFWAYAISWTILIPYTLAAWGVIGGDWTVTFALHTFGPAMAAITMVGVIEGKAGLRGLRSRVGIWRLGWKWYLFILLGIPAMFMIGVIFQPGAVAGFLGVTPVVLVSYPVYYVAVWFAGGPLGEEIGWRGFALPRMQPRYGPLRGTLLLGVLWTFWHLEDFLTKAQGGGPGTGWAVFFTNFPIFLTAVVGLAIVMTWLFNHTRGSIFAAISAHASVDTPELALVPLFPAVGATNLVLGLAIGMGMMALLILILTRGRLGYRPSSEQGSGSGRR